jgi:hypothetical protein
MGRGSLQAGRLRGRCVALVFAVMLAGCSSSSRTPLFLCVCFLCREPVVPRDGSSESFLIHDRIFVPWRFLRHVRWSQ